MEIIESLLQSVDVTMKTSVMLQYYLGSDTIDNTLSAAVLKAIGFFAITHSDVLLRRTGKIEG